MFDSFHNFMLGPLRAKLRKEIEDLRVFGHLDLVAHAHRHAIRYIGAMPEWHVRCSPRFGLKNPDIAVFEGGQPRAIMQFVFALKPGVPSFLPAPEIEEEMRWLKQTLNHRAPNGSGRGYVVVAYDYDKKWFAPQTPEKQQVFIVSINCRDVMMHGSWRPKWDELKKKLL
jgi:hypothetical protein